MPRAFRPGLEALEDRLTPAQFFVNALTDTGTGTGNSGDLRYCITQANLNLGNSGSDTILFGVSGLINLTSPLPAINDYLSLTTPPNSDVIINGNGHGSVFTIGFFGETVSLSGLTITGGSGGIENSGALTVSNCTISGNSTNGFGGGIFSTGTLTLSDSTISGNSASLGGGNAASYGGGIFNSGTSTLSDCTVSGNSAVDGGGILNFGGTLTVNNSTISGNSAHNGNGGGIANDFGYVTLSNSTISGNSAFHGGGIYNYDNFNVHNGYLAVGNSTISRNSVTGNGGVGGGIDNQPGLSTATLFDTIVAGNSALNGAVDPDFAGAVSTSVVIGGVTYNEGFNLIGDDTGSNGFSNGVNGDQVGTSTHPINPELGALQFNGGPTETMAPLVSSPAINAGAPSDAGLPEFDQRGPGFARFVGSRVDIGAYEYQSVVFGAPALLTPVSGAAQNTTAGSPFATLLQVEVTDSHGNPVPNQLVAFSAPASGPSGAFNALTTVMTNSQGIATAPTLTANRILGSFNVAATVAGLATPAVFKLNITPTPAAIAVVAGSAQKVTVNGEFAKPLEVRVTGASKQPIAGITVVFHVTSSKGAGAVALGPLAVVTNASGIATSPLLIANTTAGSFTVLASVAGLGTQAQFTLTNTASAAASISVLSGSDQSAAVGKAYGKPLQALVKDSFGNPVSGVTVTFTAPDYGASGKFGTKSMDTAVTNASGVATAPVLTANSTAGSFTVTAVENHFGTFISLWNVASAPTKATANAGTPQTATVGQQFGTPLQIKVTNASGKPVSGVWVTFSAPASGASGQFSGRSSISFQTDSSGIATAPTLTANTTAGKFNVTATVSGLASAVLFSLTNQAGSPASIVVAAGSGQSVAAGGIFGPLVVSVADAFGNVVSGVTVTFTVEPNAGAGPSITGYTTATATTSTTGYAIAPALTAGDTAGVFAVVASINGLGTVATFTLTIT